MFCGNTGWSVPTEFCSEIGKVISEICVDVHSVPAHYSPQLNNLSAITQSSLVLKHVVDRCIMKLF